MNILVFAAHPDDDIIGTGGTIAKLSKEGHNCYAVICSNGESLLGTHIFKKTVAIETRISEATKAGELVLWNWSAKSITIVELAVIGFISVNLTV